MTAGILHMSSSRFGFVSAADTVEAVGANEDGRPSDILVTYRVGVTSHTVPVADGTSMLAVLRQSLQEIFAECGGMHWGTQMDMAMLAEALNVGFMTFTSAEQGHGQWINGLNLERGDHPFWILLYWLDRDPAHYQLLELQRSSDLRSHTFFSIGELPEPIVNHYNSCNASSPIGQAYYGGIS